jgi:hypothetical protein
MFCFHSKAPNLTRNSKENRETNENEWFMILSGNVPLSTLWALEMALSQRLERRIIQNFKNA